MSETHSFLYNTAAPTREMKIPPPRPPRPVQPGNGGFSAGPAGERCHELRRRYLRRRNPTAPIHGFIPVGIGTKRRQRDRPQANKSDKHRRAAERAQARQAQEADKAKAPSESVHALLFSAWGLNISTQMVHYCGYKCWPVPWGVIAMSRKPANTKYSAHLLPQNEPLLNWHGRRHTCQQGR